MKRQLLLLLLIVPIGVCAKGLKSSDIKDEKFQSVIYDFMNDTISSSILKNENSVLVIKNVNTFKYKIKVNDEPINTNTNMPDIIEQSLKSLDTVVTHRVGSGPMITSAMPIRPILPTQMNPRDQAISLLTNLKQEYPLYQSSEAFYNMLQELLISDLSTNIILDTKRKLYNKYLDTVSVDNSIDVAYINYYYNNKEQQVQNIISKLKINNTLTKAEIFIVDSISKSFMKLKSEKTPIKLVALYANISESTFTVRKFLSCPDADVLNVTITATPTSMYNKGEEIRVKIPFIVNGGFKVDYSVGLFVSNIVDEVYKHKAVYSNDSIIGYNLVQNNESTLGVGIAGYMHAYFRRSTSCNYSLTLGVGVDQNAKLRYMPGVSFWFGRKERFILNLGAVVGKVNVLSNVEDTTRLYKVIEEPRYSEPYKVGWYVGLSYNLGK